MTALAAIALYIDIMDRQCNKRFSGGAAAQRAAALWAAGCVLVAGSRGGADEVVFKNGRSIEGIVREETDSHIVLDLGVGSMRISRARIERIVRSGAEGDDRIEDRWRDKYFLHRRYVPLSMRGLGDALRRLSDRRQEAVRAQQTLANAVQSERELRAGRRTIKQEYVEVSRLLMEAEPGNDPEAYNALVHRSNALKAALTVRDDELEQFEKRLGASVTRISAYMEQLTDVQELYESTLKRHRDAAWAPQEEMFLELAGERLAEYSAEFNELQVPAQALDGGTLVRCVINGRQAGTFILDTGAAIMSLSHAFAEAAGVDLENALPIELVVADGRKVQAHEVVLESVAMGDARVEQVRAVVLPGVVRDNIDGLLGMTFLKHFVVRLDGGTGRLLLRRFDPH